MKRTTVTLAYVNLLRGTRFGSSEGADETGFYMPLGLLYVGTALLQAGYEPSVRIISKPNLDSATVVAALDDNSRVLGISCMSSSLPVVLLACEQIKRENPDRVIMLGGVGTAFIERQLLESFPYIDVVVSGEGEITSAELLDAISTGADYGTVQGIYYRDADGTVCATPERPLMADLNTSPFPAVELLPKSLVPRSLSITTSRGCFHNCIFCQNRCLWNGTIRQRTIENCLEEILVGQQKLNNRMNVYITDDLFVSSRERVKRFCKLVKPLGIEWACCGRVNTLDEETVSCMREAGCNLIALGVESGSNKVLSQLDKGFTIEQALASIEVISRYMEYVRLFFMWGFPFESVDDLYKTIAAMWRAREVGTTYCQGTELLFSLLTPLAGTRIAREYSGMKLMVSAEENIGSPLSLGDEPISREAYDLVVRYPDIFRIYYAVDHEELQQKIDIITKLRVISYQR